MEPAAWSVVIAAAALGVAGWGVIVAHRANGRSKDANAIAEKSLAARQRSLPSTWSSVERLAENLIGFRNQSSRDIMVEGVTVEPEIGARTVSFKVPLPTRVEYGDFYPLRLNRMLAGNAEKVILRWRYEDSAETQSAERIL
jgi:hypothetical protein